VNEVNEKQFFTPSLKMYWN